MGTGHGAGRAGAVTIFRGERSGWAGGARVFGGRSPGGESGEGGTAGGDTGEETPEVTVADLDVTLPLESRSRRHPCRAGLGGGAVGWAALDRWRPLQASAFPRL